jgi:hypothetical protein
MAGPDMQVLDDRIAKGRWPFLPGFQKVNGWREMVHVAELSELPVNQHFIAIDLKSANFLTGMFLKSGLRGNGSSIRS